MDWSEVEWRRVKDVNLENEINESDLVLFDGIDIDDVNQGGVPDCWVIAILASLINKGGADYIKYIFNQSSYNKYGAYSLKLFVDNKIVHAIVDDKIMC